MKNNGWVPFLQRWLINTAAVLVATYMVKGIHFRSWQDLFVATLLLGILNAILRPLLLLLSLPIVVLTLGLFFFVINALLLLLVSWLMEPKFAVDSFGSAFWGGLVISLVATILNTLTGTGKARMNVNVQRPPSDEPPRRGDGGGGGPVIDV